MDRHGVEAQESTTYNEASCTRRDMDSGLRDCGDIASVDLDPTQTHDHAQPCLWVSDRWSCTFSL